MPLDDLFTLIHELRERIDAHGDDLRKSEPLTRYALIDPLLRALGWNTADPALVVPEYKSGGGSADYALLGNGKPLMMVEAKRLGTLLGDVVGQVIGYCLIQGTEHFAVSDGSRWEVYETRKKGEHRRQADRRLRSVEAGPRGGGSAGAGALEARRASRPRHPRPRSGCRSTRPWFRSLRPRPPTPGLEAATGGEPSARRRPSGGNPVP